MERGVDRIVLEDVTWEVATRRPAHTPHIARLMGYDERTRGPSERREIPGARVALIVELGPPLGIYEHGQTTPSHFAGGFVAGLDDAPSLTTHDGWQRGVQIDLTPPAVRRLFGVSMEELARRVTPLNDLLRPEDRSLPERLASLGTWGARLDTVERWLEGRIVRGAPVDRRVAWALDAIEASGGNLAIATIQETLQLSRPHLARLFREHVGVTPKLYARLVRFERLTKRVTHDARPDWATLATELGYFDQSHLVRDVRAFAEATPTELVAQLNGGPASV